MPTEMPSKLNKSPLLEAIFEIRFAPSNVGVAELLPGLLYGAFKSEYKGVTHLPPASIPREIRERNPAFVFKPSFKLEGEHRAIQIGDRVLSLSSTKYPGWTVFKSKISELLHAAMGTGLISKIERFSLRYTNILDFGNKGDQLNLLKADFQIFGGKPMQRGFQLRMEHEVEEYTSIIQLITSASSQSSDGKTISGLLIDVDTLRSNPEKEFWMGGAESLEKCHEVLKKNFFTLLTDDTISKLDPVK